MVGECFAQESREFRHVKGRRTGDGAGRRTGLRPPTRTGCASGFASDRKSQRREAGPVSGKKRQAPLLFQQIQFPQGAGESVDSSLAGATTDKRQDLLIDAEGTVTPRNKSSVIVPLALTFLAGRALNDDGNQTLQAGVASNGFGLVGRIIGTAAGSRELAAGIGYYAAALSIYENWLSPGRDVIFPLDTRIEIETSPLRAPALKPSDGAN